MQRTSAALIYTWGCQLEQIHALFQMGQEEIARKDVIELLEHMLSDRVEKSGPMPPVETTYVLNNLLIIQLRDLLKMARNPQLPDHLLDHSVTQFQKVLQHALMEPLFLVIPTDRRIYYLGNALFGEDVGREFSNASRDIDEAGKCFACARWTAAVFHLMRVLEIGLRKVADDLGIAKTHPDFERKEMGKLINLCRGAINTGLQNSTLTKADRDRYDEALAYVESAKNAWRNYVDHARENYTQEQSVRIWASVDSFMRALAKRP